MKEPKSTRIKKITQSGDISDFSRHLEIQMAAGTSFKILSSGMSRRIVFENGHEKKFFGMRGGNSIIPGSYFVGMMKRSVEKYVEKYGVVDKQPPPTIQMFNEPAIAKVIDKPIVCIDLNLCYWRTAYLLDFINEDLYKKGLKSGHKRGMLVSVGALNKLPLVGHYVDGKCVNTSSDYVYNSKYSPFYWAILNKVNDLAMEIYKVLKDDMYMWLTDCAFVSMDREVEVKAIMEKYGYKYKTYTSNFVRIDNLKVEWFDCKHNMFKGMPMSGRSLEEEYTKWKNQRKSYEDNTILETKTQTTK